MYETTNPKRQASMQIDVMNEARPPYVLNAISTYRLALSR